MKKHLALIALSLVCFLVQAQYHKEAVVHFDSGSCDIDTAYLMNGESLRLLEDQLRYLSSDPKYRITQISFDASASPHGDIRVNDSLSLVRLGVLYSYVNKIHPLKDSLEDTKVTSVDWGALKSMVKTSDIEDKGGMIEIVDNVPEETWKRLNPGDRWLTVIDSRNKHLMDHKGGRPYRQMEEHIYPALQYAKVMIYYTLKEAELPESQPKLKSEVTPEASANRAEPQPERASAPESTTESKSKSQSQSKAEQLPRSERPRNPLFAVKTNIVGLAMGVANIGLEYPFLDKYSADISLYYSPYTLKRDWNFSMFIVQPEFRYWLASPLKGHFAGAHAHFGLFNVATTEWSRYQNSTEQPLWGFGLTYGYALQLSRALNLEAYIGAGYASIKYDTFYNIKNGAIYDHTERGYWGLTRAGISLSYIINRK